MKIKEKAKKFWEKHGDGVVTFALIETAGLMGYFIGYKGGSYIRNVGWERTLTALNNDGYLTGLNPATGDHLSILDLDRLLEQTNYQIRK